MNKFYKEFADEIVLVDYDPWESSYDNEINDIELACSELYRRMFVWHDGKVNPCDFDYKSTLENGMQRKIPLNLFGILNITMRLEIYIN